MPGVKYIATVTEQVLPSGEKQWLIEASAAELEPQLNWTDYPLWSQRDPKWGSVKLGHGGSTFAQFGCLVTASAMGVSGLLRREVKPDELNEIFKDKGVFVDESGARGKGNLMRFAGIWECFPEIEGAGYYDYPYPKPADPAVMVPVLDAGGFALVKVDFDPKTRQVEQHWVLVTKHLENHVFEIHDPWPLPEQQMKLSMPPAYGLERWRAKEILFRISMYRLKASG